MQISLKSSNKSKKRKWPFDSDYNEEDVKENVDDTKNENKEQKVEEEFKIVVKLKFDDTTLGVIIVNFYAFFNYN